MAPPVRGSGGRGRPRFRGVILKGPRRPSEPRKLGCVERVVLVASRKCGVSKPRPSSLEIAKATIRS